MTRCGAATLLVVYLSMMAIDPRQIELSPDQQRLLADAAERTGRPWSDVLAEALRRYSASSEPRTSSNGTFYDSMSDVIGVVTDAPVDLSTNPVYLEGFGRDHATDPS
jgi:hypothetical protein